jgi:uncharacterized repeat protein (TIGR02543 family)
LGWANSDSATTASINPGDPVTLTKNKTVYAVWAPKYKLSFNLRDGTGTIETQVCYPQSTNGSCDVTVPMNEPEKEGYHFSGWITADDNTNIIHGGATLALSSDLKLYALWSPIYTVTFYKNDNTSTVVDTETCYPIDEETGEGKTSGSCSVNVPDPQPSRNGYFFLGWSGTASQNHATKTESTIAVTGNKDYYAIWAPYHTLSFDVNGGTGNFESQTCHPDTTDGNCSVTIPNTRPTRDGYTFLGWANSSTATTAIMQPGGALALTASKTIYAVWVEDSVPVTTFTLSYDLNGGTGSFVDQTCDTTTGSCGITIRSGSPTKNGYNFLGWADTKTATTATMQPEDPITLTTNKTIYAIWAPIYTVSFNTKGGNESIDAQTCYPNATSGSCNITIPNIVLTKDDYSFLGWNEDESATEATNYPGQTVSVSSSKAFYAVWEEKTTPPSPDPTPEGTGEVNWIQDQTHTKGNGQNLIVRVDYNIESFVSLEIDNTLVSTEHYTVTAGSTVVSINYDYIDTLATGEHTIILNFTNDTVVNTTFTIEEAPDDPTPDPDPTPNPTPTPGTDDEDDILVPDTSMVNGSDDGSYGGYLIGASVIVAIFVIITNIVRKIKTNRRIQFK